MPVFRAMNTDVTVLAPGAEPASEAEFANAVQRVFAEAERTFSRFEPGSELSRLNQASGPTIVSPVLFEALQRAHGYWEMTGGWFEPAVGLALRSAGYDRSFSPGSLDRLERTFPIPDRFCFGDVHLDRKTRTVTLPQGTLLDFGGFVKGRTVDVAAAVLPDVAAVDAGGDAFLSGSGADGCGWVVDVEDPSNPGAALVTLRMRDQAVATSGPNRRHWRFGTRVAHHLIDPHTGEPARTDLVQVTVVCQSAELADVLAKTAYLKGHADGAAFVNKFPNVGAVFVLADGGVRRYGDLEVVDDA